MNECFRCGGLCCKDPNMKLRLNLEEFENFGGDTNLKPVEPDLYEMYLQAFEETTTYSFRYSSCIFLDHAGKCTIHKKNRKSVKTMKSAVKIVERSYETTAEIYKKYFLKVKLFSTMRIKNYL